MEWMVETVGAAIAASGFAGANRAHIEVSRDDEQVMVYIKQRGNVVRLRLEPKAALELAIAIATKAKKITDSGESLCLK